jgi:hypothetical protein
MARSGQLFERNSTEMLRAICAIVVVARIGGLLRRSELASGEHRGRGTPVSGLRGGARSSHVCDDLFRGSRCQPLVKAVTLSPLAPGSGVAATSRCFSAERPATAALHRRDDLDPTVHQVPRNNRMTHTFLGGPQSGPYRTDTQQGRWHISRLTMSNNAASLDSTRTKPKHISFSL